MGDLPEASKLLSILSGVAGNLQSINKGQEMRSEVTAIIVPDVLECQRRSEEIRIHSRFEADQTLFIESWFDRDWREWEQIPNRPNFSAKRVTRFGAKIATWVYRRICKSSQMDW